MPGKTLLQVSRARTTVQVSPFQGLSFSPAFLFHLKIWSIIILEGWTHFYPSAHARAFPKFSLILIFFFSLLVHQRIIYSFLQALIFYLVVLLFNSPEANNTQKDREYSTPGQSVFAP